MTRRERTDAASRGLTAAGPAARGRIESLRLIEAACWQELQAAARQRDHGWRAMTLATWDGAWAQARTVTLREVDPAARHLVFYADDRSPKIAQIRAHPQGTLQAWCPTRSWQVRARVWMCVETDEHALHARWSELRLKPGAQDYLSPLAPGDTLQSPSHERGSREHFTLVRAEVRALDWLELHADGHRRAVFDVDGARWVQP